MNSAILVGLIPSILMASRWLRSKKGSCGTTSISSAVEWLKYITVLVWGPLGDL